VSWFAGNQRRIKLTIDPAKLLGETIAFTMPPTGAVREIELAIAAKGTGPIRFDVGCDGVVDGEVDAGSPSPATNATKINWTAAVQGYLDWAAAHEAGPYRDESGWRIVPVRMTAGTKAEVTLSGLRVIVR
jgi:hypothetical protein